MKILLRIICCILVAVAILWWRPGPASFAQRLVAMPATMSWEMVDRAMKARPSFCMPRKCRVS